MPYIPTNLYPKNCAIERDSQGQCTIDFLAKMDLNDNISRYILYVYKYLTGIQVASIDHSRDSEAIINNMTVDLSEYGDTGNNTAFPINEDNEFKLSATLNLENNTAYYWKLYVYSDEYDVWYTEGNVDRIRASGNTTYPDQIDIISSLNFDNASFQRIYNSAKQEGAFTVVRGSVNFNTIADNIETNESENKTIITLKDAVSYSNDITNMYITIDTTEYIIEDIDSTGRIITATGVYPLVSTTVFGQYINIYRKWVTLNTENIFTSSGEYFSIYSSFIGSPQNYFTVISRQISNFNNVDNLGSPVYGLTASYDGKVSWYQFELRKGQTVIDKTEKIYSNKISYQYNSFYCDMNKESEQYELKLTVHDIENCDITKTITINSTYKREGTNDKLKCSWDKIKKAIKVDMSDIISSEATVYKDNQIINGGLRTAYEWEDNGLHVLSNAKIEYKQKTEGKVEFPSKSNILIKLKLDTDKDGNIFDFGNKTFAVKKKQDKGLDMFVFDKNETQIYDTANGNLISSTEKDIINTQYYLDSQLTYTFTNTKFDFSNILAEHDFYILITQSNELGTVKIWSTEKKYTPKTFNFNSFNNIIDGITLYDKTTFKNIKVSMSDIIGINIQENTIECEDETAFAWDKGTLFSTMYQEAELNVSNYEPFPQNSTPDTILVYKKCSLLNEDTQFLFVGSYPYNTKCIYDYSVADSHDYTYYVIKTYKDNTNTVMALSELISQTITPDFYEIDVFGVDYEKDKNVYILDKNQVWYFELDALGDDISFNNETSIYSSNEYVRVNKTNVNYMSGTITVKLGKIQDEIDYVGDNRHTLDKFKKFANSTKIKIIRLKDGHVIPVDIQLKQKKSNSIVIGNPTDITFDWCQIADSETAALVAFEVEE